jgi:hypothetical protein
LKPSFRSLGGLAGRPARPLVVVGTAFDRLPLETNPRAQTGRRMNSASIAYNVTKYAVKLSTNGFGPQRLGRAT